MMQKLRRYKDEDEGSATVEFVLVFSFLIVFVFAFFELGWLMSRQMMLDRGIDIAMRDVRLGRPNAALHDTLRDKICEHSKILKNCRNDLVVELVRMDISSSYPRNEPNCRDRTDYGINPVISYTPGGREEIMFVRACMIIDPIFPGMGIGLQLPKDTSGGFQMVSYSAFMNEPL